MFKLVRHLARIVLVCTLFASTKMVLADDVYRCGKVYQDSPCAGGNSRPINEKPFRPSIDQRSSKIEPNKTAPSKATASSGNTAHAKTKQKLSKRKPAATPEHTEAQAEAQSEATRQSEKTQSETTQNASATTNAQTVLSPPTITTPAVINPPVVTDSSKPTRAEPVQETPEKESASDEQGICSSLNAGLKNIAEQKAKGDNSRDLKQQQKNLESAKKSAGC